VKKLAGMVVVLCLTTMLQAQGASPGPAVDEIQVVTYIDLNPGSATSGLSLLTKQIKSEARSAGCRVAFLIREAARPNHFIIVERWHAAIDRDVVHKSDSYKQFRADLLPMLASPLDERAGHQVAP
jgi:quinol monooxygenase YgiN